MTSRLRFHSRCYHKTSVNSNAVTFLRLTLLLLRHAGLVMSTAKRDRQRHPARAPVSGHWLIMLKTKYLTGTNVMRTSNIKSPNLVITLATAQNILGWLAGAIYDGSVA